MTTRELIKYYVSFHKIKIYKITIKTKHSDDCYFHLSDRKTFLYDITYEEYMLYKNTIIEKFKIKEYYDIHMKVYVAEIYTYIDDGVNYNE